MSVAKTPTRAKQSKTARPIQSTDTAQASKKRPGNARLNNINNDTRRQMIAEAAYFIAEHRGFTPGNPETDWLNAEREINRQLGLSP